MEERWREIERVDKQIRVNQRVHERIKNEIDILNLRLQNVEKELSDLNTKIIYLGKKAYGDPKVRSELIESGKKCSNKGVRQAAEQLQVYNTDIKWEDDVKWELISMYAFIDRGSDKEIENSNFVGFLAKIGKLGYTGVVNEWRSV